MFPKHSGTQCPRCGYVINTLSREKVTQIRQDHPKAFSPWSTEDDKKLTEMLEAGESILNISIALGRQPSSLRKRMGVLEVKSKKSEEVPTDTGKTYLDGADDRLDDGTSPAA